LEEIIEGRKVRDWVGNDDVENRIRDDMEDYLYDLQGKAGIPLTGTDMDEIMDAVIAVARNREGRW
jgi:type I restriction enzyme R subunit